MPGHTIAVSAFTRPRVVSIRRRRHVLHQRRAQKGDAAGLFQPSRELRNGRATFDAQIMRRPEHRLGTHPCATKATCVAACCAVSIRQARPMSVAMKASSTCLASARRATTQSPSCSIAIPAFGRDLGPDVARAHRALPARARLLPGHGDEAEVANGGADRVRIAVDDDHALAAPCGRQRMGKTDDAGADDGDVEAAAAAPFGRKTRTCSADYHRR